MHIRRRRTKLSLYLIDSKIRIFRNNFRHEMEILSNQLNFLDHEISPLLLAASTSVPSPYHPDYSRACNLEV